MMKPSNIVCENCNRRIGKLEKLRKYNGHQVCPKCYNVLALGHPAKVRTQLKLATYAWLRWPAILLGSVGVLGILSIKLKALAAISAFFNMPSIGYCYVITTGAVILFGISVVFKQPKNSPRTAKVVPSNIHHSWRGL